MKFQPPRAAAGVGPAGTPVLLLDQNRALWDQLLIRRGLAAIERIRQLNPQMIGGYSLPAAIAACHARARSAEETDWEAIVALYDTLVALTDSPIVKLNRSVAVGMASGPQT